MEAGPPGHPPDPGPCWWPHLSPQLCHLPIHAGARTQLILQVFRHAAQLVLVGLLQYAELRETAQAG